MTVTGRRAVRLEHLLTAPNASMRDLDEAVALAMEHDLVAALTVSPWLVNAARRKLGRSRVRLGTVIGYGHGGQLLAVKAFEASKALEHGANQLDFVMNGGALVSGEDETVYNDMLGVIDMAHSALASAGVIIEAEALPEALVRKACRLAERAGVDQVITSTGGATARHAIGLTSILRDSVGPRVQVKSAGRFKDASEVTDAFAAGAVRVASVLTLELLEAVANEVAAGAEAAETEAAVGRR
ncbi:MAG TPA: deoxyribose-phosphate aldolase [Candidatus Limnocylindria bacterium]|nr:deoxyribose-phosphate aldolase [Candidatus Limnocylindria bacterium]